MMKMTVSYKPSLHVYKLTMEEIKCMECHTCIFIFSWLPNQIISLILIFGFLCRSSIYFNTQMTKKYSTAMCCFILLFTIHIRDNILTWKGSLVNQVRTVRACFDVCAHQFCSWVTLKLWKLINPKYNIMLNGKYVFVIFGWSIKKSKYE